MNITAGEFKGRKVKTVQSNDVRPTSSKVRESIFNMIQSSITDSVMLDLFAGSGIMGLEAISRGSKRVVYVEKNPKVASIIKQNIDTFPIDAQLIVADALKALTRFQEAEFDIVFVDPPYKAGLFIPVLQMIFDKKILKDDGIVVIEHASDDNFDDQIAQIGYRILKDRKYGDTSIRVISYNLV